MFTKRKIAAVVAEFLGTAVLALTFLTVSRSTLGLPYFVGLAAGLAIIMMGMGFGRDMQLNPAYTLALWTSRRVRTSKAIMNIIAQLLAGWAAYGLYKYITKAPIQHLPSTFDLHILVAEALGTFVFSFAAAGALFQRLQWPSRAVVTGGAYALGTILAASISTGFINPATALASNAWAWGTFVLGPVIGAVLGVLLFGLLFAGDAEQLAEEYRAGREGRPNTKLNPFARRFRTSAATMEPTKVELNEDDVEEEVVDEDIDDNPVAAAPAAKADNEVEKEKKARGKARKATRKNRTRK